MAEFDTFWAAYPRKVGKLAAMREYTRARGLATAQAILDGVEQYPAHKPEYADWCHPRTFLSQGRWMDEYDEPAQRTATCDHEPTCNSPQWCMVKRARERGEAV